MTRPFPRIAGLMLAAAAVSPAAAIDHGNLDRRRPLRFEDAYPVAHREAAIESGVGAAVERESSDRAFLEVQGLYGLFPNMHVEIGSAFSTDPEGIEEPEKSGDLRLGALYNFNQETLYLPAFSVKGEADFPTGVDSDKEDFELTGIATRSFGRLGLHLNAGLLFVGDAEGDARDERYRIVPGASFPIGAPRHTRTTLLADLFMEQSDTRGGDETYGAEAGVRYQLSSRFVIDAGVGSEFDGPSRRKPFYGTAGLSYAF